MRKTEIITTQLFRMNHVLNDLIKEALSENTYKLTRLQATALLLLESTGKLSMSEIAQYLSISRPNTTPIIQKLSQLGYVKRLLNPDDQRIVLVSISDTGHDVSCEIKADTIRFINKKLKHLSANESSELAAALQSSLYLLTKAL